MEEVNEEPHQNPNNGTKNEPPKPNILVIMGPTGSGKSKLAIDLSTHFPIEVINADSMQVYDGLDVLTNKVTLSEQKGVVHHLLGSISPDVEFTSKDFRDVAVPLIEDILSRNHLPVIVGGTNFYIQALVSPFLLDDAMEDENSCSMDILDHVSHQEYEFNIGESSGRYNYDHLRAVDPVAANRIHPNDQRKIRQYLELFSQSGILPSQLFQGQLTEKWGQLGHNSKYNCCFVCVDASLPALDRFVDRRVDKMIEAGLLDEVYDIYTSNADYTRGLRQAIGVREFEDFLGAFISEATKIVQSSSESASLTIDINLRQQIKELSNSSFCSPKKHLLEEAILKLKTNTRRLVRRQKRRINRLQTLFGWNIHFVDSTDSLLGSSEDTWIRQVVEPASKVVSSFLISDGISAPNSDNVNNGVAQKLIERNLWTQYTCEACGNRVLRGAHEWEQHKQGRGHRKRISKLKKHHGSLSSSSNSLGPEVMTTGP